MVAIILGRSMSLVQKLSALPRPRMYATMRLLLLQEAGGFTLSGLSSHASQARREEV